MADEKARKEAMAGAQRRQQREDELTDVWQAYLRTLSTDDGPYPFVYEIMRIPEVLALLEEDECRVPVTQERVLSLLPVFREDARKKKADLVKTAWDSIVAQKLPGANVAKEREYFETQVTLADPPPVAPLSLQGIPDGMPYGSDDVLGLATSLFQCSFCYYTRCTSQRRQGSTLYSAAELTRHLHNVHNTVMQRCPGDWCPQVDSEIARRVLEMMGLPEDTLLADVSGRAICMCPGFKVGSTFSELVRAGFVFCLIALLMETCSCR